MTHTKPILIAVGGVLAAALALALALSGEPAGAAFPGKNGEIAFGRCLKPGQEGVFAVDSIGGGLRKLTGRGRQPSWSPNGRKIAYTRPTKPGPGFALSAIYKMKANGKKQRRLTKGNRGDQGPSWSPNGKKIVFTRQQLDGSTFDLYTMKANGKRVKRLTRDGNFKTGPVWSPNGKKIAYSGFDGIYTINTKGKKLSRLVRNGFGPDWSPNGKMIVFADDGDIYTIKPNGKQKRPVNAENPAGVTGYLAPAWSPDGTKIAAEGFSKPGEVAGIYRIDADGANPVELAKAGETSCDFGRTDSEPDWQPR